MQNYNSYEWLYSEINFGSSQRDMANKAGVSTPTIRSWLKKHSIKPRTISEALSIKKQNRHIWTNQERANHSEKMKLALANKKELLSTTAKNNWIKYRDNMMMAAKKKTNDVEYKRKISVASKKIWANKEYKDKISNTMKLKWQDKSYANKVTNAIRIACNESEYIKKLKSRTFDTTALNSAESREKAKTSICKKLLDPEYRKYRKEISIKTISGEKFKTAIDKIRRSKEEFIELASRIHNNEYDYSDIQYIDMGTKVAISCKKHGIFWQLPQNHISKQSGCPKCSTTISTGHQCLLDFIDTLNVDRHINDRNILSPKEIDIYIPSHNLGIEYHGIYYHSENKYLYPETNNMMRTKCRVKHLLAIDKNIKLLQFYEHEIINQLEIVKSMISNSLGQSNKVYARNCDINIIDDIESKKFLNNNHMQGYRSASHSYGLILNGQLISLISLTYHNKYWEIIRYATMIGTTVVGGFSKLLTHFIRSQSPTNIITFADARYSIGKVYEKYGFNNLGLTQPNYKYIDFHTNEIISRQKCQKHKLSKLLGDRFDINKSEYENMIESGYGRLWDAGNYKFRLDL